MPFSPERLAILEVMSSLATIWRLKYVYFQRKNNPNQIMRASWPVPRGKGSNAAPQSNGI